MKAMPEIIKEIARKLRKNMTKSEKVLWENIRR
jgi:very-short-patch-repair endonuclease